MVTDGQGGVVGIMACQVLELELARLLTSDPDLEGVTVLEDDASQGLIQALEGGGCRNLRRISHVRSFSPLPSRRPQALVRVLEMALHRSRQTLRTALVAAGRELAGHADALFLGYGLCGNALQQVRELLDVRIPLVVPRDGEEPVDDCIGLLLGGGERYRAELRRVPGTFFITAGWTRHLDRMIAEDAGDPHRRAFRRMFDGYVRSLLVVTPVMSPEEMGRRAEAFNALLGLRVETCQGSLDILAQAWRDAKVAVTGAGRGRWERT